MIKIREKFHTYLKSSLNDEAIECSINPTIEEMVKLSNEGGNIRAILYKGNIYATNGFSIFHNDIVSGLNITSKNYIPLNFEMKNNKVKSISISDSVVRTIYYLNFDQAKKVIKENPNIKKIAPNVRIYEG